MVVLGHVHPGVRLVRLQPGLDAGGHRHAHRRRRRQHHARVGGRRVRRVRLRVECRFGKPDASMMCNGMLAGHGGDHRAVRVRDRAGGGLHRRRRRRAGRRRRRCSSRTTLKIDDPVGAVVGARRRAAPGASCRSGLFADGRYGDGWNGVAGPVRGLFYGDGVAAHRGVHRRAGLRRVGRHDHLPRRSR